MQVLRRKFMSSIPHPVRHLLTDRASWRKYYKPRLDPGSPGRYPSDWDARLPNWRDADRPNVVFLRGGGLYGYLRDWMGLENLSLALYDDPAWFEEMVRRWRIVLWGCSSTCSRPVAFSMVATCGKICVITAAR